MNIVTLTHILIIVLLMLETSSKLKLKDSLQFSVLTSSIVLLLSTLINNLFIMKINTLVEESIHDPNSNTIMILKPLFMMLNIVGDVIGKNNIPFFTQVLIMLLLYGFLKGYIRKMLESSNLIIPVSAYPSLPQQPYTPAPHQTQRPQGFTLGGETEAPSLADIEKLKKPMQKEKVKQLSQKIVEGAKIGTRGTIEFIGENKKFRDESSEDTGEVILPSNIESKITKIIQQEEDEEGVGKEIMNKELKKKREQEKEMTKQLAQMIRTNIDVELNINDQKTAWNMAIDYLQGHIMDYLQLPPEIAMDSNRYRILQTLNMSKEGYFKFTIEFFLSANTLYYFDVYVFKNGQVQAYLKNVLKY